jgi:hypothetical protein
MNDLTLTPLRRSLQRAVGPLAALALCAASLSVARSGLIPASSHVVVAWAASFDLAVTSTLLVWWLGVRRGHLPRAALAITALLGLVTAWLVLPAARAAFGWALLYGWGALELALFAIASTRVASIVRHVRAELRGSGSLPHALERGFARGLPGPRPIARLVAGELSVGAYALGGWFRRPRTWPATRIEPHAGLSAWRAIVSALVLLVLCEGLATHLLLQLWSPLAAWIATASHAYAVWWLLGDYQLVRLNPVRLTATDLRIELGLRGRVTIPRDSITQVRSYDPGCHSTRPALTLHGAPDTLLELHREIWITRGLHREATRSVALRLPAELAAELTVAAPSQAS